MKNYKNKKYTNINDDQELSSNKGITKKEQNYYLNKYHKAYGNSFNDIELIDIFEKNNYNDNKIVEDINALLSIGNDKKLELNNNNNNYMNYNSYERVYKPNKSKSKSRGKKNKYEKRPFQKCIEIPSDYAPPPKKEEENLNNEIKNEKEEQKEEKEINNNNDINHTEVEKQNKEKNDILLTYKENLFKILKNPDYSYKSNKSKTDELGMDNVLKRRNEYDTTGKKMINLNEKNRNKNKEIENNSPGPQCQPYNKNKYNQNINKELKKKYIQEFFGNMKKYSNNIRRANWEKSPDFNRKENILDTSPEKTELYNQKVLTYKKGLKNYYTNDKDLNKYKNKIYRYLKIDNKVNDIFITACYDNPQRDQYLKIINEKRKENPDKIIEFLIPAFPPMFPSIQPFQNMYSPFNQYNPNPFMNMYMMPQQPQFPMQTINPIVNNLPIQNSNTNTNINENVNNNKISENNETPGIQNPLTPSQIMQLNNNNQINEKINNTPNPNSLLLNNNASDSRSNKSSDNLNSNSGNNNIDANIHL